MHTPFKSCVRALTFIYRLQKSLHQVPHSILEDNLTYAENDYNGAFTAPDISIFTGKNHLIFSAPHAVNHLRNGKLKYSEPYTGAIVKYLNEKEGCHGIVKSRFDGTDPNWITGGAYKKALLGLLQQHPIHFLIDLHCMHHKREQEIVLCTDYLSNVQGISVFRDAFIKIMQGRGFQKIEVDTIFKAKQHYILSKFISMHAQIPAIQVEVNLKLLNPQYQDGMPFRNFVNGLREYARIMNCFCKEHPTKLPHFRPKLHASHSLHRLT